MGHTHSHNAVGNMKIAFFLNLIPAIIEFVGGILTNSVAIMSDALHDLGDSFSVGLAWFLEKYSNKKRTDLFSYGYKRFSLLGAFINGVIVLIGSVFILYRAIPRLINPEPSNAYGMILLAILGIIANGIGVYKTAKGKTLNQKVISLHLLEDFLGWIAVLIVSIVLMFTDLYILDPILSVLITLYILWGVVKNLRKTILLFLQATPENLNTHDVDEKLKKIKNIYDIHDTHIWSLDGEHNILSTHIVINDNVKSEDIEKIKKESKLKLEDIGIQHSTIEIEYKREQCNDYCE